MTEKMDIDASVLLEAACGDAGIARDLLNLFFKETGGGLDRLEAAVREGDAKSAATIAHKLVGSVMACGLERMARDLRKLELSCEDGFPVDVNERIIQMRTDLEEARTFFEGVLSES